MCNGYAGANEKEEDYGDGSDSHSKFSRTRLEDDDQELKRRKTQSVLHRQEQKG